MAGEKKTFERLARSKINSSEKSLAQSEGILVRVQNTPIRAKNRRHCSSPAGVHANGLSSGSTPRVREAETREAGTPARAMQRPRCACRGMLCPLREVFDTLRGRGEGCIIQKFAACHDRNICATKPNGQLVANNTRFEKHARATGAPEALVFTNGPPRHPRSTLPISRQQDGGAQAVCCEQ